MTTKNHKLPLSDINPEKPIQDQDIDKDSNIQYNQKNIAELAEELAYNYFSNSFGDDYNMQQANCHEVFEGAVKNRFIKRIGAEERVRNIIVVGAGASFDAYKCIPTGTGLIEEMRETYENRIKSIDFLKRKFTQDEEEIKDITGREHLNFENYLYLLSKFFVLQKELREKIREMTGIRHVVSLFDELVAHLLKHAYVDVVINFNFDETMDRVINEEIGHGNYHHVISDGNCVELSEVLVDGRLKMPIYIKPHGTYSHKSTLRFTNRHYFDLPNDLKKMLEELISGQRGTKKKPIQRVNLIVVGFALESLEFNKVLNSFLPADSVIYHIDYVTCKNGQEFFSSEKTSLEKNRFLENFLTKAGLEGRNENDIYKPINTERLSQNIFPDERQNKTAGVSKVNRLTPTFGELFSEIIHTQHAFFRQGYLPRSIARHEIISYLFYQPIFGLNCLRKRTFTLAERIGERHLIYEWIETNPKYFRDKVLVELFILLSRTNGIADTAEILKGRTGIHYNLYRQMVASSDTKINGRHSIYELLDQFSEKPQKYKVKRTNIGPSDLIEGKEYQDGKNIFILQPELKENDLHDRESFERKINELNGKICEHLNKLTRYINYPEQTDGELKIGVENFRTHFYDILIERYNSIMRREGEGEGEDQLNQLLKFNRTITLFYRLMTSELISNFFKFNFLLNFNNHVFNGRKNTEEILGRNGRTMLSEMFRLLSKSWTYDYFVINSAPTDPIHNLWESFSKRKLINTNLGLTAEFCHLFSKDWDALLSITETGASLNFLNHLSDDEKKSKKISKGRHMILICSESSVKQLHHSTGDDYATLMLKHKDYLLKTLKNGGYDILGSQLTVLAVPFNQHNHHATVFLQCVKNQQLYNTIKDKETIITNVNKPEDGRSRYFFLAMGSLYKFRHGFSSAIDPLYIGLADNETTSNQVYRDQFRLIDKFVVHLLRAFNIPAFADREHSYLQSSDILIELNKIRDSLGMDTFLETLYMLF